MTSKIYFPFLFVTLAAFSGCEKTNFVQTSQDTPVYKVVVTTIAGKPDELGDADGQGPSARFSSPRKICFNSYDNKLYVADHISIRSIDRNNQVTTVMAKDQLSVWDGILDIAAGNAAGSLYFTTTYDGLYNLTQEGNSYALTELTKGNGNSYGPLTTNDHLDGANGVAMGLNGDIAAFNSYWACLNRFNISAVNAGGGIVENWAGKPTTRRLGEAWPYKDGQGAGATFGTSVNDISSDNRGNIYIADQDNAVIRKVEPNGTVTSIPPYSNADGNVLIATIKANGVSHLDVTGDGRYIVAVIPGFGEGTPLIRLIEPGKSVTSLTGFHIGHKDGSGEEAAFGSAGGVAISPDGREIYLSEYLNGTIRKITIQ